MSEEDEGGGDLVEEVAVVEEAAAEAGAAPVVSKTLTGVAETFINVCFSVIATTSPLLPPHPSIEGHTACHPVHGLGQQYPLLPSIPSSFLPPPLTSIEGQASTHSPYAPSSHTYPHPTPVWPPHLPSLLQYHGI